MGRRGDVTGAAQTRQLRARQGVAAVREGIDQAVGDQPVQGPGQLHRVGPDRLEVSLRGGDSAVAQQREQPSAALPVRALVTLGPAPGRGGLRGAAGGQPGAVPGHRAGGTARIGRGADDRAQFHHRDGPSGRDRGLGRQQRFGQPSLGRRRRLPGRGWPPDQPGQHAADVGVEHGMPLAEREAGHGRGGVAADARQGQQGVDVGRHRPAVPRGHDGGRLVQPQRAPRVPSRPHCLIASPAGSAARAAGVGHRASQL